MSCLKAQFFRGNFHLLRVFATMMVEDKRALRLNALRRRDALTTEFRADAAEKLTSYLSELMAIINGDIIAGYWPIRTEISPLTLMGALKERGYRLALPALVDNKTMIFRDFDRENNLIDMDFGTRGPSSSCVRVDPTTLLIPLAAFDDQGNRIGYGAGYYDRAIATMHARGHRPLLVGVGFDCQRVQSIPKELHDQPLAMILTESGLRNF